MTKRRIHRRRRARLDIDAAIDHYLVVSGETSALNFIDTLEDAIRSVAMYPEAGSTRYADDADHQDLRSWPMQKFPYVIFYFNKGNVIDVWRVLHASRDMPKHLVDFR